MPLYLETKLEGFFPPQSSVPGESTTVLHVRWNASRRVYLRTSTGILPPQEDEPLGRSASASFNLRLRSASDVHPQIRRSLAILNFTYSVNSVLCPTITAFALRLAACRSGPSYPSMVVFAHLNFVEKLYVDSIHRPLAASSLVDETFVLGTSTEYWGGAEEDNKGTSDSAIETLRRRKLERRGREEESCSVCLEKFSDGEEVIPLRCEHIFHESCIVTWLKKSQSCPLCRRREI